MLEPVQLSAAVSDLGRFLSPANLPKRAKWHHVYGKAVKDAKSKNRPMILLFTGDGWCRPCKYLERKVFLKQTFHDWALKNVVLAKIDVNRQFKPTAFNIFERKAHDALVAKYRIRTVPFVLILSPSEKPIGILRFSGQTAREWVNAAHRIIQHRPSIAAGN